jgi:hypothetical protein
VSTRFGRLATLLATATLAACSEAQSPIPPHATTTAHRAAFTLRIRIPRRESRHADRGVRPQYVSPATQGMTVAIAGPAAINTVVSLTPGSNGCSNGLAGTTCQFTVALPPCVSTDCYLATIVTYDAVSCVFSSCAIPPGAHELSAAENVPFTIVAGENNVTNLTLDGIPATIDVTPLQPGYISGDAQHLQLWGAAPQRLAVVALDADGNVIVGPGSPGVSAASSSATLNVTPPVKASPNTIVLTAATTGSPPTVTPGVVSLSLTATPPSDSGGSPVTLTVPVAIAHSAVYVGLYSNAIDVYYDGNTSMTPNLAISGSRTAIDEINQVAVDGNGTLYVTNAYPALGTVLEFPAGAHGNVAPTATISGAATTMNTAYGVAVGSNGVLYVSSFANNVTEFAPGSSGNVAPVAAISGGSTDLVGPECIALDAFGTLYVADEFLGAVLEFQNGASGNVSPDAIIFGSNPNLTEPLCVAIDNSGALYVSDATPQIVKFAPGANGNAVPVARMTGGFTNLNGLIFALAVDAGGTIYAGTSSPPFGVQEFPAGANGDVPPAAIIPTSEPVFAVYAVPAPNLKFVTL